MKWLGVHGEWLLKSIGLFFGGGIDDNILKLIVVIVAQLCEYAKKYWTVNFK